MKKTILPAIVILIMLMLTACSNSRPESNDPKTALDNAGKDSTKTELVIATISNNLNLAGFDSALQDAVAGFNQSGSSFHVTIRDYSQNGTLDRTTALQNLNTEIISGKYPDMICFSSIPVYPYLAKELLVDLAECIALDGSITLNDIVCANALLNQDGGVFYLSGDCTFSTLIGKYSEFGERYGWSVEEYLDIESKVDPSVWVIYNTTHTSFLNRVASRYSREAINWASGSCDFDNPAFINILNASKRIQDKPETDDNALFGLGGVLIAEGKLITAVASGDFVYNLALCEHDAGEQLSYIGWPTGDGKCGTDLRMGHPVGIISKGAHVDGCWEFIKYMLLNGDPQYALPMYMPRLLERLEDAKTNKENPVQMTDQQVERFLALLSHIRNVAIYDDTVMSIIMTESEEFFAEHKTAEETAKVIQSKISLYVAEQQ